jgi:hypothetical protein
MTQMLTGHGVFGEYLLKIGREVTSICHYCGEEEDTAQHTLEFCPAWAEARRVLQLDIGERLAPEAVVEAMLRGSQEFNAVRTYCEEVMQRKERTERDRERRADPSRSSYNTAEAPYDAGARRLRRCPGCVRLGNVALGGVVLLSFPTQAGMPPWITTTAGR